MKKLLTNCVLCSGILLYSCSNIPTKGLVAHYTFKGGNANDKSGNNNHGTTSTVSFTSDRFGVANESVLFDSENDFVKVTNPSFLNSDKGTLVAWVKFDKVDHVQYVASAGDEGSTENYISFLRLDPARHTLGIYQRGPHEANWIDGTTIIGENAYYHLVMLSNGTEWSIYVNGVKEKLSIRAGDNTGKWIRQLNSIDNFVIGSSKLLAPYTIPYLSGNIDEILLYDRPLTDKEIEELYMTTKPNN